MKKQILFYFCIALLVSNCAEYTQDLSIRLCQEEMEISAEYSKAADIQEAMDEMVRAGVPGCAVAVYSEEGWWETTAGLAKIEDQTPLQSCHLQYLQSISKTYMAVAVLKLYEEGKIGLDEPITQYLPERYSRYLTAAAEKISVRMLLNHTSGLPDYNFSPDYVAYLLQHPDHYFTPEDYLGYIEGKDMDFAPGSKYAYRNINYVLLALITDAVTGDHAAYIAKTIFHPLGLTHTFYRNDPDYLKYPELVNAYWDRYSNGIVENVSEMQRNNVAAMIGDDGIVTTPSEAVAFLRGLLEGQLLSAATLAQMQDWVTDSNGNPRYGLGLARPVILEQPAYGHSGGGLGAGCELYYFPEKNIYFFIGINLGTVTDSPLHERVAIAREKIYAALLK